MKLSNCQRLHRCMMMGVISFLVLSCVGLSGISMAYASKSRAAIELPEPTGPYGIGTTQLHLTDPSRLEEMTPEPDDHREMMVQIWYPASKNATEPTVPYMDAQTSAYLMQSAPDGTWDIFETVRTHAMASAPPAAGDEPFPVLIFSSGLGLFYSAYQSLIEDVVSHGYVVAAINHPYISGITVFPDGRSVMGPLNNDLPSMHSMVVEDMKFLAGELNAVTVGDSTLFLDADNIGFFGHSLGGSASVETCLLLPQGKGAMNLDGGQFGQHHVQPIEKPLFFMSNQDRSLFNDRNKATAWRNMSRDGYLMRLEGSSHHTFMDLGFIFYDYYGPDYTELMKEVLQMGSIEPDKAINITREYILAFFNNCLKGASSDNITAIVYPEARLETLDPVDMDDSTWRSVGYGYALHVEDREAALYEMTEAGRWPRIQGRLHGEYIYNNEDQLAAKIIVSENNVMMTYNAKDIVFEPADASQLPPVLDASNDPELNFQVFWQTFEENCSLFERTGVDWNAHYDHYRSLVTADMTDAALFSIFSAMVAPLNDGHTTIADPVSNRTFKAGPTPSEMWTENIPAHMERIALYMDDGLLHSDADGLIRYGVIGGDIGYLNILSFSGYANGGDEPYSVAYEKLAFDYFIDNVLIALKNSKALIIDCRFNQGGHDPLALALANRFTEQKALAWSKDVRIGDGQEFSTPVAHYLEPSDKFTFLNGPIILLTSNATAGAAEAFTMAMDQMSKVIRIGEKTYGAFSNPLTRTLPNGWTYTLSNERYYSWQGIDYEQVGITPDIELPYYRTALTADGEKDQILERGLDQVDSQRRDTRKSKE